MLRDEEFQQILQDFDNAKKEHQKMLAEMNEAVKLNIDLGWVHSDGSLALRHANAAVRAASERYRHALQRYNDHCRKLARTNYEPDSR